LVETVRHDPCWYGLGRSTWTCALLAGYLAQQTGISMSAVPVAHDVALASEPERHGALLAHPVGVVGRSRPAADPGIPPHQLRVAGARLDDLDVRRWEIGAERPVQAEVEVRPLRAHTPRI
jgi:hypothetical protein